MAGASAPEATSLMTPPAASFAAMPVWQLRYALARAASATVPTRHIMGASPHGLKRWAFLCSGTTRVVVVVVFLLCRVWGAAEYGSRCCRVAVMVLLVVLSCVLMRLLPLSCPPCAPTRVCWLCSSSNSRSNSSTSSTAEAVRGLSKLVRHMQLLPHMNTCMTYPTPPLQQEPHTHACMYTCSGGLGSQQKPQQCLLVC